jgi:hypothetical protein
VQVGFQNFVTHFLDEVLFQGVVHINDLPLLGDAHVALDILFSCVIRQPSFFIQIVLPSFLCFLASFDKSVL